MNPRSALDSDWVHQLRSTVEPVDTGRLKRVGVGTYFGVYALIAVGGWRALVGVGQRLPPVVRPPALPALHAMLGLPRSLAWGLVSLSIALGTVSVVAGLSITRARTSDPASLDDLGGSSWFDWTRPTSRSLTLRLPGRSSVDETDSSAGNDALSVVDGSLDAPEAPLSLPRTGGERPMSPAATGPSSLGVLAGPGADVVDTSVFPVDATDADRLESSDDGDSDAAAGGATAERTDGGVAPPDPDAPWPDDWIAGDDL